MKKNKGITLVALVVTIIVLVILATISITMVLGNAGIFTQAEEASLIQRASTVQENVDFYKMDYTAKSYINTWETQTEEDLLNNLLSQKLVKEEEINREEKKITIGNKVIDYTVENPGELIMTVNSGENGVVQIPIGTGTKDIKINWGDGNIQDMNTTIANQEIVEKRQVASIEKQWEVASIEGDNMYHNYTEKNKEYKVKVTGKLEYIFFSYIRNKETGKSESYPEKIVSIDQWGTAGLTSVDLAEITGLKKIASASKESFKELIYIDFRDCTSLVEIGENLLINVPKIEGITFQGCTSLKQIPENLFENCTNIKGFEQTFYKCTSLESIPENLFKNCTNVTDFSYTFTDCTSLKSIPEKLFENNKKVNSMYGTFWGCTNLQSIPTKLFEVYEINENKNEFFLFLSTFKDCTSLTGNAPDIWNMQQKGGYVDVGGGEVFKNCTGLSNYDQIPEQWK